MTARGISTRTVRRSGVAAVALVLLVLAGSGCDPVSPSKADTSIDVDTPELREMKADAGIADCAPGPGGGQLPDLTLPCLGGGPDVNLADLKGPLLINLWFSGCGPCRKEMPALARFDEDNESHVQVLGIDIENYPESAISFAGMAGATYPQLADPGGYIFDQADLHVGLGFPQSILIDKDGVVVGRASIFESVSDIEEFVDAHLGGDEPR